MKKWLIKNKKTGLYLTEYHLGKGRLTDVDKDWTDDKHEADRFDAKPTRTIDLLNLSHSCEIVPFEIK